MPLGLGEKRAIVTGAENVRGTTLVVKAALPHLNDNARVINLASELAFLGRAGSSAYCATKERDRRSAGSRRYNEDPIRRSSDVPGI